jgi:hypothetical protein
VKTVRSETVTAIVEAPTEVVFDYLADIENMPAWADEFARELRYEGETAKVVNNLGELYFRIDADPSTGVIDMYAGPREDAMALFPTRVVALGGWLSAYTFTMFQAPDMSEELFESQHRSLQRELDNVRRHFA